MWRAGTRTLFLLILLSIGGPGCTEPSPSENAHLQPTAVAVELPGVDEACASELFAAARRGLETESPVTTEAAALGSCGTEAPRNEPGGSVDGGSGAGQPEAEVAWDLLLSLGRRDATALVARGTGSLLPGALDQAVEDLRRRSPGAGKLGTGLKLDVVAARVVGTFDSRGRADLDRNLHGLWLPGAGVLLLPEELTARRLVNGKVDLRTDRLQAYLQEGGRPLQKIEGNPGAAGEPYSRVAFSSFYQDATGEAAVALFRGNRLLPDTGAEALLQAAVLGGEYLVAHQQPGGRFDYLYETKRDELDDDYNLLRHAGTCYSLFELYDVTGDRRFLEAGDRGLTWLRQHLREPKAEHADADFLALVSPGEEAKLGGAALTVLAMLRYQQATGDAKHLPTMRQLARFMVFMQGDEGRFESKYFYGKPDPEPFESIYYPGEAVLALARLSRVDDSGPWLETSMDGAGWLMGVRDLGKSVDQLPHDHWLLMGLEELYDLSDEGRTFYLHARRIAEGILRSQRQRASFPDWIGSYYTPPRSTPTATRSEALVAMTRLARRTGDDPRRYLEALERSAAFQLRTQLRDESVLYLPRPDRSLGGFRRSLDDWEVRIDYVQHNVSALLGLRSLLLSQSDRPASISETPAP
ncbi:MAG: hypothetical protein SX243_21515 [Acidobacteriota bacterium]|nr:hypothetical protein [Acidobacteriota bacterium]